MALQQILLIDDDSDDQLFFTEVVKEIDPAIVCNIADNGREGFVKLREGFLPDIIFLDLNMPYMNGFDFLETFRQEAVWDNIPVVIFTTSSYQPDKDRATELKARAFLTKPNTVQALRTALEELIR